MAPKSKQQRINEGNALIAAIKQDPILAKEQSWLLRFLNDLVTKFKRGKGGTKRQRELFDEKIAAGVPARKVNTHVSQPEVLKAEAAIKVLQKQPSLYSWEIRVGGEIVANGLKYNLSAKQLALLDTFVKKAEQLEAQYQTPVSLASHTEAQLLCDLADTYIGLTAKKSKDIDILRAAIGSGIGISDEQLDAGRKAVSGELKKYNKYKSWFTPGLLVRYLGSRHIGPREDVDMAMVVDGPSVADHGNNVQGWQNRASKSMRIPLIVNGELIYAPPNQVQRYTKKELKRLGVE